MNKTLGFATAGGFMFFAAIALAEEQQPSLSRESTSDTAAQPSQIAAVNSRGNAPKPTPTAVRAVTPQSSRGEPGTLLRRTISNVVHDTSHIVVQSDTAPIFYRFTKATQFVDEGGRAVSSDAVKSGTNASLFFTRNNDDVVLSKVVVMRTAIKPFEAAMIAPEENR